MPSKRAVFRRLAPLVAAACVAVTALVALPASAGTQFDLNPGTTPSSFTIPGTKSAAVRIDAVRSVTITAVLVPIQARSGSSLTVKVRPAGASPTNAYADPALATGQVDNPLSQTASVALSPPVTLLAGSSYDISLYVGNAFDRVEQYGFVGPTAAFNVADNAGVDTIRVVDGGGPVASVFTWNYASLPHLILVKGGDSVPPTVTITPQATPLANGWFGSAQTNGNGLPVVVAAHDDDSGVAAVDCVLDGSPRTTGDDTMTYDLHDGRHALSCTATDKADNTTTPAVTASFNVDETPPAVQIDSPPGENANGWFDATTGADGVDVRVSADDNASGVASMTCTDDNSPDSPFTVSGGATTLTLHDGIHDLSCTAVDNAGNASEAVTATYKVDQTLPAVAVDVLATEAPNGWYNRASSGSDGVDVRAVGRDGVSSVARVACTDGSSANAARGSSLDVNVRDGRHHVECTATDAAGNVSAPADLDLDVDQTPPVLEPTVSPDPVYLLGSAAAEVTVLDPVSGAGPASCGHVDTSVVGPNAVRCDGTDGAGNATSTEAPYLVVYDASGFTTPSGRPTAKAGSSVPVKFSLGGYFGLDVVTGATTCDGAATGTLTYDAESSQYVYVWKTDKAWAGSTCALALTLRDTTSHSVAVAFR